MTKPHVTLDVSDLPNFGYGTRNPLWWGNLAFMVIEGLGFLFAIATYLYLYNHNKSWPLGPQAGLLWPSLLLGLLLLSELPNIWLKRAAEKLDLGRVRIGLVIMSLIGLLAIVLRAFEFTTLHVHWDDNAYGSILWFLLGLHTAHIITDVAETIVITVMMFIGPIDMRRFPDIEDNQDYWHFVVFWWIAVYGILYWLPRWLEVLP
jgi:cytochrome c oxidase subunit 3